MTNSTDTTKRPTPEALDLQLEELGDLFYAIELIVQQENGHESGAIQAIVSAGIDRVREIREGANR